jgi:hypothetical protein
LPTTTDSGELFIKLDWRQIADNSTSTFQVAALFTPVLLQTNFISELGGRAIAELPLHLIGHSRGGSLMCELSRLLGTNGVWVDHLTTLDPHPLNNDGFHDIIYTVVDAPARTYDNVLFHDNYFQRLDSIVKGETVAGSYTRQLTNLDGGYPPQTLSSSHSDVHLWYHGTVDTNTPASDTVSTITVSERQAWWNTNENSGARAGFFYSLLAAGDRLSTNQPAGPSASRIRDGYNQRWNLGVIGITNNRTALPANNGSWPNIITANLLGTNLVAFGQSNMVVLNHQWALTSATNAAVSVYLDGDANPFNGNEQFIRQTTVSATGSNQVGTINLSAEWRATNASPGIHSLFVKIDGGGKSRYLYAPERITILSSFQAPSLTIAPAAPGSVRVDIHGLAGQRVFLQSSSNLFQWQTIATNWLSSTQATYLENLVPSKRFYRAIVQ